MGNECGPLYEAGRQALVEWQDPQLLLKPLPCDEGRAWQEEHALDVPENWPPRWQLWQLTLR
jgi:hypothetical protein